MKRKDLLLLPKKLIEKVPDLGNAKEHYESFLRKTNRKSSRKLSKTVRPAEKVSSNSSLYSKTNQSEIFLNEKNIKTAKREHAFKGYASTYNVEILNCFKP